ncbi:MAG: efflux RND transporter periplasmic adaptor subunit, partial [Planctomycetota bacterium]
MKRFIKPIIILAILGVAGGLSYNPVAKYLKERNRVQWETEKIIQGDITRYVESTGTIQPVLKVSIGSFVSGPIVELNVDYNDKVKEGDLLARVDPRLFKAALERDEANLESQQASLQRVEAQLEQALRNYQRALRLRERNKDFMSDREMDALTFDVKQLQASRRLSQAGIKQATAALEQSKANLNYCEIRAPVDGIIINRLIQPGQTLASQFQTPELFVVAPDLREKIHVFASVDEADIGLIQKVQSEGRPVKFTVDSHPDDEFEGRIEQLRLSSTTTQSVVTYPVVIAAPNPDMKLLPDMTASIQFEVDAVSKIRKIPNAALRFFPKDPQLVREVDRGLVDGSLLDKKSEEEEVSETEDETDDDAAVNGEKATDATDADAGKGDTSDESADADTGNAEEADTDAADTSGSSKDASKKKKKKDRKKRHVWVIDGEQLRAVEIRTGLMESK